VARLSLPLTELQPSCGVAFYRASFTNREFGRRRYATQNSIAPPSPAQIPERLAGRNCRPFDTSARRRCPALRRDPAEGHQCPRLWQRRCAATAFDAHCAGRGGVEQRLLLRLWREANQCLQQRDQQRAQLLSSVSRPESRERSYLPGVADEHKAE